MLSSRQFVATLLACFINTPVLSVYADWENPTPEELEAWFNDDAEERALNVNEGELKFLTETAVKNIHYLENVFTISHESLNDGWVRLQQCHNNLDAVPDAQIVYRYHQLRNFKIDRIRNIEKAWLENKSVQLKNVHKQAELCISTEVLLLRKNQAGEYTLTNGPFHRRFLDGYYPMRVRMTVDYPASALSFKQIIPSQQPGFEVTNKTGSVSFNALFEGKLITHMVFATKH